MTKSSSWVVLAELLRPQGRKGELLSELLTDFPERFDEPTPVYLAQANFDGPVGAARKTEILSYWLPLGKNHGRIVLKFAGIDTISQAEMLAGLQVVVPYEERLPLEEDSSYISDLLDCRVFDKDSLVGMIVDVQFPSTADGTRRLSEAAPILVLESADQDEILIPFVKNFIRNIDVPLQRIDMDLPDGLIDINR